MKTALITGVTVDSPKVVNYKTASNTAFKLLEN